MDIEETKKRKVEEEVKLDLDVILKSFVEANQELAKVINALAVKIISYDKIFNKDLFNKD